MTEARAECKRLEEVQRDEVQQANERRGMTIAPALREGREPTLAAIPSPAESAALVAATANLSAHEVAAKDLHREAAKLAAHTAQIEGDISRVTFEIRKLDVAGHRRRSR